LPDPFKSKPLDEQYARLVAYSDCMIDTGAVEFKERVENGWVEMPKKWEKLPKQEQEDLLDKMISTEVVGRCSQDLAPRKHAMNIAILAAETANWVAFLRAHLDVMNDNFPRVADMSIAHVGRNTYIRELEEININVNDLVLGISIFVDNPAQNHYFGSVARVGRALAEAGEKQEAVQRVKRMIKDDKLDDHNRAMAYFLMWNYIYNLDNVPVDKKLKMLGEAAGLLPKYLGRNAILDPYIFVPETAWY